MRKLKTKIIKKITGVVALKTNRKVIGNVLISYITAPFMAEREKIESYRSHTNKWECWKMAKIFLKQGYNVDIIDWDNGKFIPKKNYKIVVDIHNNLERMTPFLNKNCVKIHHITAAHWLFQNKAEYSRLSDLKKRRNVVLIPRRIVPHGFNIEHADCATMLGNEFTTNTYAYANKPIHPIPLSTTITFPNQKNKQIGKNKKKFLWLGGGGMVHKGLDLVLEAFSKMPDFHLTVCGPVSKENDFEKEYYAELYKTPNIKTIGRIDVGSKQFLEIANNCIGLIYPSCSEGQAGSVVTCMHAGLIPIVSYQSGVDVDGFGVILNKCSIEEIKNSITDISNLSTKELKIKTMKAWKYANRKHTRENFNITYKKIINKLIKNEIR